MTEQKPELLPCPFCRGEAITNYKRFYGLKPIIRFGVSCQGNCGIFLDERAKTEAEAIAAWNTRAPAEPPAQSRGEVIDECAQLIASTYECSCDPAWTVRNRHSPDCFGNLVQELSEDLLALKGAKERG
jgi:hypothetical protein